jgi:hypothetical protein
MINQEIQENIHQHKNLYLLLQKKFFEKDKSFLNIENLDFLMNQIKENKSSSWLEKSILLFFQNQVKYNFFDKKNEFLYQKPFFINILPNIKSYNFFNKEGDTFFINVIKNTSKEMKDMAIMTMIHYDKNPQEVLNIESKEKKTPLLIGIENGLNEETLLFMIVNEAKIKESEFKELQETKIVSKNILENMRNKAFAIKKNIKTKNGI